MSLREDDGATNDFSEAVTYSHRYSEDREGWSANWDSNQRRGYEEWEMHRRDQEKDFWGNIVDDGCWVEMTYTVSAARAPQPL
jgi:hypothetical protein